MPTETQTPFMFSDTDEWRNGRLESIAKANMPDTNCRMTYLDLYSEAYPLALNTAFEFLSRNHDGRYRDRTLMSIRRWAFSVAETDVHARTYGSSTFHDRKYPSILVLEAPFSYDEDTEAKSGGIIGLTVCVDDGDGDWRGILAVSKHMRNKKAASALVQGFNAVSSSSMSYYAHSHNFLAARTAASLGYAPVAINAVTNVIQYRLA
jgi:hypothetical protein